MYKFLKSTLTLYEWRAGKSKNTACIRVPFYIKWTSPCIDFWYFDVYPSSFRTGRRQFKIQNELSKLFTPLKIIAWYSRDHFNLYMIMYLCHHALNNLILDTKLSVDSPVSFQKVKQFFLHTRRWLVILWALRSGTYLFTIRIEMITYVWFL